MQTEAGTSLGDLYEIEKINKRVANQIDRNVERTKEIVTLEEEIKNRFLDKDLPKYMFDHQTLNESR